jgi:predicted nucleic acid-binding protein
VIGYFDTSAVLPLVVAEPGSPVCARLWLACDRRASSLLVVAEAAAALAQARRLGRLTEAEHVGAAALLDRRLEELDLLWPTRELVDEAAGLAVAHGLRGYDAVHTASALALKADGLVAVSGDQALLGAWVELGLDTADPNALPMG